MSSAFTLTFQAPPARELSDAQIEADFAADVEALEAHPQALPDVDGLDDLAPLRMSKGARTAAAADGVSEDAIRTVIAAPHDIQPDATGKGRMRLRRGSLTVVVARDGAVLSIRDRKPHARRNQEPRSPSA